MSSRVLRKIVNTFSPVIFESQTWNRKKLMRTNSTAKRLTKAMKITTII